MWSKKYETGKTFESRECEQKQMACQGKKKNTGANDVANSFSTAVAAKTITHKQASMWLYI